MAIERKKKCINQYLFRFYLDSLKKKKKIVIIIHNKYYIDTV